jgi:hypothetical protein
MKLQFLLLSLVNSNKNMNKIINKSEYPLCKNCIYYKPTNYNTDFTSFSNKCTKFGEQNIVTGEINYNSADYIRNSQDKCGIEGKFYEEEPNINGKIIKHFIISHLPYIPILLFLIFTAIGIMP